MKYAAVICEKEETKKKKVFNSYATEGERMGALLTVDYAPVGVCVCREVYCGGN